MVSRSSEEAMKVHMHTRFCVLCVVTFLFQQCSHCHGDGHHSDGHARRDRARVLDPAAPDEAESEQRFYIQQLFRRYGQRDRLDFGGFQNLLLSLGLGEVKVVGLEHEELGHDHVAHLDLLEVQEGLHSHSPSHPHDHGHEHEHDRGHEHDHGHEHEHEHDRGHEHDHGHEHEHDHEHPHPHPRPESSTVAHDLPPCKQKSAPVTASPTAPVGPRVIHSHDHYPDPDHDHDHDHNPDPDHNHDPDPDHDHEQGHHNHEHDDRGIDRKPHRRHKHRHKLNGTAAQAEQPGEAVQLGQPNKAEQPDQAAQPEQLDAAPPSEQPAEAAPPREHKAKRTRGKSKASRSRNRGSPASTPPPPAPGDHGNAREAANDQEGSQNSPSGRQEPPPGEDRDHSHGEGHVRMRRREAPESPAHSGLAYHHPDLDHQHEECLNLTQLLHYYGLSPDSLISPTTFTYLCPALLYQIDSRVCIRHYHQVDIAPAAPEPAHSAWTWVWGFVSITIISLLSLLGVVLVPILNQSCFKFLLTFLVALAVGTLSGDALLHLLPHSQGQHDHSHDGAHSGHADGLMEDFDGVWKGLTALAGIYLLFIIEHCIGMFKHYKDQGGTWCRKGRKGEEAKIGRKLSDHKLNRRSDAEWLHLKPLTADGADSSMLSCEGKHNDTQLSELQEPGSPRSDMAPGPRGEGGAAQNGRKAKTKRHGHSHSHGHAHQGHCHSDQEMKDAGVASIAWMVIMGDGMHNFSDGLAIGAAFSANVTGGISTSVAVFCHELPHELGDFAVLLKAGMSVKQALVYNVLSALMAYVGMLIGTAVGQYTHNVTSWIFAITAGMFLYVALVDMLPEMLHGDSEDHKRCQLGHFLLQNVGMLTGFGIMLLIAIFEDRIVLDFGF